MHFCAAVGTRRHFGPGGDGTVFQKHSSTFYQARVHRKGSQIRAHACGRCVASSQLLHCAHLRACIEDTSGAPMWSHLGYYLHRTLSMWKASAVSKYVSRARTFLWTHALLSRLAVPLSLSVQPSCSVFGPFEFSVRPVDVDISDDSRIHEADIASTTFSYPSTFSDPSTCSFGFINRQNGRSGRVRKGPELRGEWSDRYRLRQC